MATNMRYPKAVDSIVVPVPEGTESNDPVAVGAVRGVAITDAREDGNATVKLVGSYSFEVSGAAQPGDVVYLNGSGNLTMTTGGTAYGVALSAKGSGAGDLEVAPYGYVTPVPAGTGD